jgi:DNA-directed RNA polymerase subunit N (RpoN/RPB10)
VRLAIAIVLFAGLVFAAGDEVCFVCGNKIEGKYYRMTDRCTEAEVAVCTNCAKLESRCFACGLPVKTDYKQLSDGRYLCARDAKEAVLSDEEAKRVCEETVDELNRQFSRFMTFPTTNVTVSIVDRFTLQNLFKAPGYEKTCVSVFGATLSQRLPDDRLAHSVSVLSALSKPRIKAVCAHEYTHTWMNENVSPERRQALATEATEAFCELIAYKLMEAQQNAVELKTIKSNPYTRGQIDALLAAEERYGFNAVLEWVNAGEDAKLDINDLDRVRAVSVRGSKPAPVAAALPTAQPRPVPDRLVLNGVSIASNGRFALINDRTFAAMETGNVRVGQSNLVIRCLEIRTNSALIQIEDSGEKQELLLGAK